MGTRCLTAIKAGNKDSHELCVIYRQFDGYPDGHGLELKKLLSKIQIVNGLGGQSADVANGMSCLAMQLAAMLKMKQKASHRHNAKWLIGASEKGKGRELTAEEKKRIRQGDGMAGGFYLYEAGTRDAGEDYLYTIYMQPYDEADLAAKHKEIYDRCEAKGDFTEMHDQVLAVGELCMTVEAAHYNGQKEEYILLYDGPIKDFTVEACERTDEEEESEATND